MNMRIILRYFPGLTPEQIIRFDKMASIYSELNRRINVISRKEIESLYENHILHSLAIAKIISFNPGSKILDVGTGAGFPGIPLAILFPTCQFVLIDSIRKRIKVVQAVTEELDLQNVRVIHMRVQDLNEEFDFVASRAVTSFPAFVGLVQKNISHKPQNALPNGIIYLKGGDFQEEIQDFMQNIKISEITRFFAEPFFKTQKVVYLPIN